MGNSRLGNIRPTMGTGAGDALGSFGRFIAGSRPPATVEIYDPAGRHSQAFSLDGVGTRRLAKGFGEFYGRLGQSAGGVVPLPGVPLAKSAGPFIGPHGGKWADADHTVPWHESGDAGKAHAEHAKGHMAQVGHHQDAAMRFPSGSAQERAHVAVQRAHQEAANLHSKLARDGGDRHVTTAAAATASLKANHGSAMVSHIEAAEEAVAKHGDDHPLVEAHDRAARAHENVLIGGHLDDAKDARAASTAAAEVAKRHASDQGRPEAAKFSGDHLGQGTAHESAFMAHSRAAYKAGQAGDKAGAAAHHDAAQAHDAAYKAHRKAGSTKPGPTAGADAESASKSAFAASKKAGGKMPEQSGYVGKGYERKGATRHEAG